MKISETTLGIFKNYSSINQNILIREGNVLSTVSEGKNILSRATVSENFPREIAIYNLNDFTNVLTFYDDIDVDFNEGFIKIENNERSIKFTYADPSVVTAAPDKELEIEPFISFDLTQEDLREFQKAASVLDAPTLSITSSGGSVSAIVGDPSNSGSNAYSAKLPVTFEGSFDCRLKIENLKVIPGDYTVSLGKKKAMEFKHKSVDLKYWLAMEPSSVV